MKTYSETRNRKPFNWFGALSKPNITANQWKILYEKSSWGLWEGEIIIK